MSELFREGLRRLEQEEATPRPSAVGLREFSKAVTAVRDDTKSKGLDKMTTREINTEIETYRRERDRKRPTKSPQK